MVSALSTLVAAIKSGNHNMQPQNVSPDEAERGKGAGQKNPALDYRMAQQVKASLVKPNGVQHRVEIGLFRNEATGALEPIVVVSIPKDEHRPEEYDWELFNRARHAEALANRPDVELLPLPIEGAIRDQTVQATFMMHGVPIVFDAGPPLQKETCDRLALSKPVVKKAKKRSPSRGKGDQLTLDAAADRKRSKEDRIADPSSILAGADDGFHYDNFD